MKTTEKHHTISRDQTYALARTHTQIPHLDIRILNYKADNYQNSQQYTLARTRTQIPHLGIRILNYKADNYQNSQQ